MYFREDDAIVVSQGITPDIVGISIKPFLKVTLPVAPEILGQLVLIALESEREGVPLSASQADDLLRFARARSWKAFEKASDLVTVGLRDGVVTVIPHRHPDRGGGFEGLGDRDGQCRPTAEEIGRLVLEKAQECE